ncbi:MAG: carboxymuconolactone decarboxylase family protein [Planctomycetales bacterium]
MMTARLLPVDPATVQGQTKELFATIKGKFGKVPNMMKTMAHSPALLAGYLSFSANLAQGELSPKHREQIALFVSQSNRCEYCVSAHSLTGKLAGLTPDEIVAARRGESNDTKGQAVLDLARGLVNFQGDVSDQHLADAREAGLSDAEIAEVAGHVALNTLTNYFNQMAQTEVDFPKVSITLPRRDHHHSHEDSDFTSLSLS